MASENESNRRQEIPLDEIQQQRGVAQEQSMNTLLSAQERYNNAAAPDSTRDSIYDAIAEAKRQISEKDKIPFKGKVGEHPSGDNDRKETQEEGGEDNTGKGALSSIGETLSSYAKNVKDVVKGGSD